MTEEPADNNPPAQVRALAQRRSAARAARDFAAADALRDEIAAAGWRLVDSVDGFSLAPAPSYDVMHSVADLPDRSDRPDTRTASVAVVVDGWPEDVRTFTAEFVQHVPADVVLLALDVGNVDGAGDVLHDLAQTHPGRIEDFHVTTPPGWAAAVTALARADTAAVHVLVDLSTIFTGDAVSPLLAQLADPTVVGAGWRGVRASDDWHSFDDAGPGDVEALLGYCFAVRRAALLEVPPHPKARFYRNADLELSFAIRDAGLGRLVVPATDLPLQQGRHHGYHDTRAMYRDAESKRTYARLLARFRGRDDLRVSPPRAKQGADRDADTD